MLTVLSIAGSDPSGGAGIQADIKTITAHKLFAETVITALTAQNTLGVYGVEEVTPAFVAKQIDAVFSDIRPRAVKVGMVASEDIIDVITERLYFWHAENVVLDPVMVSTSGSKLISDEAVGALKKKLLPMANIITPNIPEAEILCGLSIATEEDREKVAYTLKAKGKAVLIKGGHNADSADDLLVTDEGCFWMREKHINTRNTHGTGCTLSSAIACNLALGNSVDAAVRRAKEYVTGALYAGLNLGQGNGPLNHMWAFPTLDV